MNYCENFLEQLTGQVYIQGTTPKIAAVGEGSTKHTWHGHVAGSLAGSTMQWPAPFDGKGMWDAYHTQFEMLARINKWNDLDKAAYLAISLRGSAGMVLVNLPPDHRQDYNARTAALQARFGSAHQTELNWMKLKARTR